MTVSSTASHTLVHGPHRRALGNRLGTTCPCDSKSAHPSHTPIGCQQLRWRIEGNEHTAAAAAAAAGAAAAGAAVASAAGAAFYILAFPFQEELNCPLVIQKSLKNPPVKSDRIQFSWAGADELNSTQRYMYGGWRAVESR